MSEKIQIIITTPGGFIHKGKTYSQGDVVTEDYSIGIYFTQVGWAEEVDNIVLNVDNVAAATGVI